MYAEPIIGEWRETPPTLLGRTTLAMEPPCPPPTAVTERLGTGQRAHTPLAVLLGFDDGIPDSVRHRAPP
jgi:hypothetical protein